MKLLIWRSVNHNLSDGLAPLVKDAGGGPHEIVPFRKKAETIISTLGTTGRPHSPELFHDAKMIDYLKKEGGWSILVDEFDIRPNSPRIAWWRNTGVTCFFFPDQYQSKAVFLQALCVLSNWFRIMNYSQANTQPAPYRLNMPSAAGPNLQKL